MLSASIFTANVVARRNYKKYPRVKTPTPTAYATNSPTPKPTIRPTAPPTIIPNTPQPNLLNVYITYYGWNDNDPPGTAIAYPKIHVGAGGVGTFDDPVTFASDPKVFAPGTKIYVPYIKKYALMEDLCASCRGNHIDIWVGGDGRNESKLISCEENLTRSSEAIEINPPNNRNVDTRPPYNSSTASCLY